MSYQHEQLLCKLFIWRCQYGKTYQKLNAAITQFNKVFDSTLSPLSLVLKPMGVGYSINEKIMGNYRCMEKALQKLNGDVTRLEQQVTCLVERRQLKCMETTYPKSYIEKLQQEADKLLKLFRVTYNTYRCEKTNWERGELLRSLLEEQQEQMPSKALLPHSILPNYF
jgi:hypothetical protein